MQNLELVLKTPIEELVPKLIEFNNRALMADAKNMLKAYEGIEYGKEMIAQAKEDRATLNKFCLRIDEVRKSIKRVYEEPLVNFTAEVNEVIDTIKCVSNEIGNQLEVFEEKRKAERRKEIEDYYNSCGESTKGIDYIKIHNPKWLNSSTSMSSIKSDIEQILNRINNDLTAIMALNSESETTLIAFFMRNLSLSEALTEHKRLENEKLAASQMQAKIEHSKPVESPQVIISPPKQEQVQQQIAETKIVIRFEVEATAGQFAALREFLIANQIIYSAIK